MADTEPPDRPGPVQWSTPAFGGPAPFGGGPPRRQVALVVGIGGLVLIMVAATAALLVNRPAPQPADPPPTDAVAEQPSASPGDEPDVTEPPATQEPAEDEDPAGRRAGGLRRLTRQVAAIRGLPQQRRLRAEALSRRALAEKISEVASADADPRQTRATEQMLIALRLAPPDFNFTAVLDSLLRAQVKGFYVPADETLYIPRGRGPASPGERRTAAHEITHALQDQNFGVEDLQNTAGENSDAGLAVLSVIEGDASLTEELWSLKHQTEAERRAAAAEQTGDPDAAADAPDYLLASLFFPYQEGAQFVVTLYQQGGFEAVDEALSDPPTSTEQILHPEKYQAGEAPRPITVRQAPGSAWDEVAAYDIGEFDVRELMAALGETTAVDVAEGWAGGQIKSWERGDDTAVALALRFDTAGDADEACAAVPRWYATVADGEVAGDDVYAGDRDHLAVECRGRRVFFGLAANQGAATRLVP